MIDLLEKYDENATRRVAGLYLGGKWVGEKVLFGASFIFFQGIIENQLEIGGCGGSRVSVRHGN
jgi:hypothetical protein